MKKALRERGNVRQVFVAVVVATLLIVGLAPAVHAEKVLRVIPASSLEILDPIWTTAYIARNHGYLIYDTLFAMDENFNPQPQMVDTWTVSEDKLLWTFTLRDHLKWHDGANVQSDDVVASLKRWGKRDGMGQALFETIESLESVDSKTFTMRLKTPYGLVLESLGKISSNVPFIMPKRVAETDPHKQITEYIGSGPFIFKKDEMVPGSKVVYVKNPAYVPRQEPPSNAAGGKVVKVDRVEWISFPDQNTALNALIAGEVDYFEEPSNDLLIIAEKSENARVVVNDTLGYVGFVRFNHLLPPFDNPEVRRAALMSMKQSEFLAGAIGDQKYWKECASVFPCGTPLENDAGSDVITNGNIEAAKKVLAASGYDGTPALIMHPTDNPVLSAFTLISAQKFRDIGMKVDLAAMDWSTLASRRASREPVAKGGWNLFVTQWNAADIMTPMAIAFSGNPDKGWFGWATDSALEKSRTAFSMAKDMNEKKKHAKDAQERLWAIGASGQLGQYFRPIIVRSNVKGVVPSPVPFFWNISVD